MTEADDPERNFAKYQTGAASPITLQRPESLTQFSSLWHRSILTESPLSAFGHLVNSQRHRRHLRLESHWAQLSSLQE